MANAILLQSGSLREFQPLGADGNPVYQSAPQLRSAIRRTLGEEVAEVFAIPQRSEDGSRIDWYAPREGAVVPWSSATPEEQRQAKQQLLTIRERIEEASRLMQSEQDSERQVFGRLLVHVTRVPSEGHVYLVDGRPVLTFWGFHEHGARADHDALMLLPVMEPAVTNVAASSSAAIPVDVVRRRRLRWWWLLLPLLLLLLLLLAFLLLRGCAPGTLPGLGMPGFGAPDFHKPDDALSTEPKLPTGDTLPAGNPLAETVDESPSSTDETLPGEPTAEELPVDEQVPDEQAPDETADEQLPDGQVAEDQAPTLPEPVVPPVPQDNSEPLVIPPEAVEQGSTDFLNGRWSADSGLMDRSGRPVDVEYEFSQGEGVARYRRSNGVVCEGPTSAAMDGSQLVITDSDNIVCQDGVRFRKSRVKCEIGDNGLADCSGSYATGDRFSVGMNKAKNN